MPDFLGLILIVSIFAYLIVILPLLLRRRAISGEFTQADWNYAYTYSIGDNIFNSARGHGIEAFLPKLLPEIFIDSHADKRRSTSTEFIKNGQQLMLEGDFNTHFQVFVARGAEQLVLSILTPDVMATLIDDAGAYDIRIIGHSLQIFSEKRVYNHADRQELLLAVAKQLLGEIDHRLQSWQDQPENLKVLQTQQDERMVKIGHRYFRLGTVGITLVTGFFGACFVLFGLAVRGEPKDNGFSAAMIYLGLAIFPVLWLVLLILNRKEVFKRR